jgi:hypothetical protein
MLSVDQNEDRGIGFKADSRASTPIGVKNVYDLERCVIKLGTNLSIQKTENYLPFIVAQTSRAASILCQGRRSRRPSS